MSICRLNQYDIWVCLQIGHTSKIAIFIFNMLLTIEVWGTLFSLQTTYDHKNDCVLDFSSCELGNIVSKLLLSFTNPFPDDRIQCFSIATLFAEGGGLSTAHEFHYFCLTKRQFCKGNAAVIAERQSRIISCGQKQKQGNQPLVIEHSYSKSSCLSVTTYK